MPQFFRAYIAQVLAKETRPGELVILDNLSSHKTAGAKSSFRTYHIDYFHPPPYSPDLNPIESVFSKLKRLEQGAAERTVDGLWSGIGRLINQFQTSECRNYFRHCGYATKT